MHSLRAWLKATAKDILAEVEIFACGPTPMLKAAATLAQEFAIPSQVSLEEFMALRRGRLRRLHRGSEDSRWPGHETRMRVDGPVFDGAAVFPAN